MKNIALRNGLWNGIANIVGAVTGIIGSIIIVRSLDPGSYGLLSYYIWLSGILSLLGTLSLPNSLTKISSELRGENRGEEAQALAGRVILVVFGINLILGIVVLIWTFLSPSPNNLYLILVGFSILPSGLSAVIRSTLWGMEQYKPVSLSMIASNVAQLVLTFIVYWANFGLTGFLFTTLSAFIIQLLILIFALFSIKGWWQGLKIKQNPQKSTLIRYAQFAIPTVIVLITDAIIWQRAEIFFLERMSNLVQVGYYNLTFTAFNLFLMLGWALINGYYPAISHDYGARNWKAIQTKVTQGVVISVLFSVPIAFGGLTVLSTLIPALYGEKMLPSVPVAQILFFGLISGTLGGMLSLTINATGGIWQRCWVGITGAIINIGVNVYLIPRMGAIGAAIGNTFGQIVTTFLMIVILEFGYKMHLPWKAIALVFGVGAVTTFLLPLYIQDVFRGSIGFILAILLSALTFGLAIWFFVYSNQLRSERNTV